MTVVITSARVDADDGAVAAVIEWVPIGGGTQTVTVDGVAEERTHPYSTVYHVRFVNPDRMMPDELRSVDSYEDACALAEKYAAKLAEHSVRLSALAADLTV